ncbi:MAG: hypothetical protein WCA12_22250 [Burkholderiales bacterium]
MDRARESQARCAVYRRRRPERTPLYRAVLDHLETYLALAREGHFDTQGVPAYVEREFRRYLECGIGARQAAFTSLPRRRRTPRAPSRPLR